MPLTAEELKNKGNELVRQKEYKEAIECYQNAIAINPEYANAWHNLGLVAQLLGYKNEAEICFNREKEIVVKRNNQQKDSSRDFSSEKSNIKLDEIKINKNFQQKYSSSDIPSEKSQNKLDKIESIYDNNAFRFLGIESNTNRKIVRDRLQSLKARIKLGGPVSGLDPLGFLKTIAIDENMVRSAINQIDQSKFRIYERPFWFFNTNQKDSEALDKLKEGQYKDAILIWNDSNELSASINLTILYHAYYIANDIGAENTEKWQCIFNRWINLIKDEKYWEFLDTIEKKSDFEPLATHEEFTLLKNEIWDILLRPNIDFMKKTRDLCQYEDLKRQIDLIRKSNFPIQIINKVEYEIFSPIEEKIDVELKTLSESISTNKNSPCSTSDKKLELDRILELFKWKTEKEINRFLKLTGNDSEASKIMRDKTAGLLRELSISYHNDADSFEQSEIVLNVAKIYAEGTLISKQIVEDLSILSEHVRNAKEFEKFVDYKEKISKSELQISKNQISFNNQTFQIQDITGIRYGIFEQTVNGIPTTRSYAIWLKCDNRDPPVKSSSRYMHPINDDIMMIECADATWFGTDKIQKRFNEIVQRLYQLIQIPLCSKMIQDFESGRRLYVSNIIIDFTGIYKDFNYNPLSKGIISISSKLVGTKDVVTKEGKHKHLSWDNYRGYSQANGKIWIISDSGPWISFSARDDWNAINLPFFFNYLGKEGNLAKSIEKCISGVTAVRDEQSEVIKILDNSIATDPKNWLTWWQKGLALKNLGRFDDAIVSFDKVLELNPKNPEFWNVKGLTLIEVNEEKIALGCFEKALAINSQLSHIWFNKGIALYRLKNYKEAIRAMDRSLSIKFDQNTKNTRDQISSLLKN